MSRHRRPPRLWPLATAAAALGTAALVFAAVDAAPRVTARAIDPPPVQQPAMRVAVADRLELTGPVEVARRESEPTPTVATETPIPASRAVPGPSVAVPSRTAVVRVSSERNSPRPAPTTDVPLTSTNAPTVATTSAPPRPTPTVPTTSEPPAPTPTSPEPAPTTTAPQPTETSLPTESEQLQQWINEKVEEVLNGAE